MKSVIIKGILEDELERTKRMLNTYVEKYNTFRKGSLFIRSIGGNQYCYLNYREGKKVISEYIGPLGCKEAEKLKEQIEERKRIKKLIKDMQIEQKEIERALK